MKRLAQQTWNLVDLVDLEILLREDDEASADDLAIEEQHLALEDLHKRDRGIALDHFDKAGAPSGEPAALRSDLFRAWIERRRRRFGDADTPGEVVVSWFRFWFGVLCLAGFLSGAGLVRAFYGIGTQADKTPPVNVGWFTLVCILPAFLITLYAFYVTFGGVSKGRLPKTPAFARSLLHLIESRLARKLRRPISKALDQNRRLTISATNGIVRAAVKSRRDALSASLLLWIQGFGLGYAVALPLLTFLHPIGVPHDFHWGGNFASSPEAYHRRVSLVALPWRWSMGEGNGYPTLQQIRDTEYIKRDPMRAQPRDAWNAWAKYLVLASLAYVFLPRALLFGIGRRQLRRALGDPDLFEYERFDRLYERMTTPYAGWEEDAPSVVPDPEPATSIGPDSSTEPVSSAAEPTSLAKPTSPKPSARVEPAATPRTAPTSRKSLSPKADAAPEPSPLRTPATATEPKPVCLLAVPTDFAGDLAEAARDFLLRERKWEVTATIEFDLDVEGRSQLVEQAGRQLARTRGGRLVLVEEAESPPVIEVTEFLKELRAGIGDSVRLVVALVGSPADDPLGDPADPVLLDVWKRQLASLGDPSLRIEPLWKTR